jgi:chromosome segregation ATPase
METENSAEIEKLSNTIEELEHRCEHLETDRNNLALALEELQTKYRMMSELYQICSSTTNKLLTQRNEARKEVCLLRNNENPDEYAALRSWDFHTVTDSDAHLAAANALVKSEAFRKIFEIDANTIRILAGPPHLHFTNIPAAIVKELRFFYEKWLELGGKHETT